MIAVGVLVVLAGLLVVEHRRRRLLEAKLARSRQLIERADRLSSLGTMTAGLAHEIRNPLSTIRTFAELLPNRYDDPDFRDTFAELVGLDARRLEAVVAGLAELASLARPSPVRVDLAELLK